MHVAVAGGPYVLEDQILPHLAALAILLHRDQSVGNGWSQVTILAEAAELIDQLRASGTVLIYDPDTHAIRAGDNDLIAVTAG